MRVLFHAAFLKKNHSNSNFFAKDFCAMNSCKWGDGHLTETRSLFIIFAGGWGFFVMKLEFTSLLLYDHKIREQNVKIKSSTTTEHHFVGAKLPFEFPCTHTVSHTKNMNFTKHYQIFMVGTTLFRLDSFCVSSYRITAKTSYYPVLPSK